MKKKLKAFFKEILNKKFIISIIMMMAVGGLTYFSVKFLQSDYHYIYSPIDNKIPFIPQLGIVYNLFYPTVFITMYYIFCKDRKNYYKGVIACIIGYTICNIIFIVYPTIMYRPYVDYSSLDWFTGLVLKITYTVDTPALNCCPSIHCLFCFQVIFTLCISKNIKIYKKILISLLLLLIIVTTLLIKQHYLYDVTYALLIVIITNIITYVFKLYPRITNYIKRKINLN